MLFSLADHAITRPRAGSRNFFEIRSVNSLAQNAYRLSMSEPKTGCVLLLLLALILSAQETVDEAAIGKLRIEAMEHSQIMHSVHILADRYGPRVTGTPNHEEAAKWAIAEMTRWGLKNGHLEPWDFGHPGWLNESADVRIVAPVSANVKFEVAAWTPSTKGKVMGSLLQVSLPPFEPGTELGPDKAEFARWVAATKNKVRGKIVMVGKAADLPVDFTLPIRRLPDDRVKADFDPPKPGTLVNQSAESDQLKRVVEILKTRLTVYQMSEQIDTMLVEGGALARVDDGAHRDGIIQAQGNRRFDVTTAVPTIILRHDDYGRIERLLADRDDAKMALDIVNHIYPMGSTSYTAIAEIPGSDKADEVVMLGAHLDSWQSSTGATDNAIGSAVMMEAARLIQSAGLRPHRTIRVALWSGEEGGIFGSQAYVKSHFGTAEDPKPEWFKLNAYLNMDGGAGRIRGLRVFGPPEAAAVLRPVLAEFADYGAVGASSNSSRFLGGSDSAAFSSAGLPAISTSQDPIEYAMTRHTDADTYEHIVPDDAKKAAAIIAAQVWLLANREEMLPRFTKQTMPLPVSLRLF
jgi:carboxypeptidase Q